MKIIEGFFVLIGAGMMLLEAFVAPLALYHGFKSIIKGYKETYFGKDEDI